MLKSASSTVPISGNYESARVLMYIYERKEKFEILTQGEVRDLFTTESLDSAKNDGFCIDVAAVNLLDCYMPKNFSKSAVAVILRTLVDEIVESYSRSNS